MWKEVPLTNKLRNIKETTKKWNSSFRGDSKEEDRIGFKGHLAPTPMVIMCRECVISLLFLCLFVMCDIKALWL